MSKTPGDAAQAEVECDTKAEVEVDTTATATAAVKKKRGRPKKNPIVLPPSVNVSPDINPGPTPTGVAGPKKKGRGRQPKRTVVEEIVEIAETVPVVAEPECVPSPDVTCPSPDVTGEVEHINIEFNNNINPTVENSCNPEESHSSVVNAKPEVLETQPVVSGENKVAVVEATTPGPDVSNSVKGVSSINPQGSSFLGTTDIFERKYSPGFIPGLDLDAGDDNTAKVETNTINFGSFMAKKLLFPMEKLKEKEPEAVVDDKSEDADNKIRRSSRIKSLEESRGPRKRREVVFSTLEPMSASSSRSHSVAGDDDSNSNSSLSMEISAVNSPVGEEATGRSNPDVSMTSVAPGLTNSASLSFTNILTCSANCSPNGSLKPLKVKSRWRYSLDAESLKLAENSAESVVSTNAEQSAEAVSSVSASVKYITPPLVNMVKKPGFIMHDVLDEELIEKLKKFDGIEESIFFTERKISKESKYMICDCYLSKEDIIRGEIGCNEDCLNRLLMVECGSRCPTGEGCTNKKFQRKEYSKLEVFKTEKKGHGLRTIDPVPAGGFVIEYVGEVLNPRGFTQRTREYAKEKQEHFYFMALRSDTIIDATLKGNCSRFINHSCEPNCETQKWTVNGELRIGFFTLRDLEAGEEITFDYQFQRYGKKAQKCFCQSEKCRGWIGGEEEEYEEDDSENKEPETADEYEFEIMERKVKAKPGRRKKKQTVSSNEFGDRFMEELATLEKTGLKNRNQTLMLCRLMVRAEDWDARERILKILTNGDQPCRRLFLDYHGLKLLHGWMSILPLPDAGNELITNDSYHTLFLKALGSLPIPNKTLLNDSQILSLVEKWSELVLLQEVVKVEVIKEEPIIEPESVIIDSAIPESTQSEAEPAKAPEEVPDQQEVTVKEEKLDSVNVVDSSVNDAETVVVVPNETSQEVQSTELETSMETKVTLEPVKFVFVDVAKQLLQEWADLKEVFRIPKKERVEQMKEHEREADIGVATALKESKESGYDRDGRSKIGRKGDRRLQTLDSYLPYNRSFREYVNQYSNMSKEERRLMFAQQVAEQEKETQKQRQMQDEMVLLHQERCRLLNLDAATTPIVDPSGVYYLDPKTITWKEIDPDDPTIPPELLLLVQAAMNPPLPDRAVPIAMIPPEEPAEASFPPWPEGFPPPPPLPPNKLPFGWEMVPDDDGRFYYYHLQTQEVTWVIPSPGTSEASDLSSSKGSSDSEEDSDQEDEMEAMDVDITGENSIIIEDLEKASKSLERRERRKLSGLVQERIISPRSEDDKPLLSQKAIRARKLELMAEKLHGVHPDELEDETVENIDILVQAVCETQDLQDVSPQEITTEVISDSLPTCSSEKKRKIAPSAEQNVIIEADIPDEAAELPEEQLDEKMVEPFTEKSVGGSTNPLVKTDVSSHEKSASSKSSNKSSDKKKLHKKSKSSCKKSTDKVELARRLKEKKSSEEYFRNQIANVIVQNLNPYRKPDCKNGRITSTEHFKHLARKLTHMVTTKEVKHCKNAKTLVVNDSVRHKTKEFVKKYMGKFAGRDYEPSPQDS
ncbi:unnamed protein product [Allacma fusca]|uniref:[histone H3]-lysine(36) N-trimethyltransferase n=1 Tax=Allacma fusca TaxID=39272 RepID=A0A8J2KG59_9HEXA|nr:unnamed protein product [Allacma fusca]